MISHTSTEAGHRNRRPVRYHLANVPAGTLDAAVGPEEDALGFPGIRRVCPGPDGRRPGPAARLVGRALPHPHPVDPARTDAYGADGGAGAAVGAGSAVE